jgi:hypothetical protein
VKALRVVGYPFTGGAVALCVATLVGMLPYAGWAGVIAAGAFAIPIVRASSRDGVEADAMPRLVPPPPGLGHDLAMGTALHLLYFAPYLSVIVLGALLADVPALGVLMPLTVFPMFLQLVLLVFLPAAGALLALDGSPLPALSSGRVMRAAQEMGGGYGFLIVLVVLGGFGVLLLGNWLRPQGWIGRGLDALLVAWFWLVELHLVGRVLGARRSSDPH